MKTKIGTKSRRQSAKKSKARRRGDVNRDNTLANWVAGMESMKGRTIHRGNTLANWVLNSS